MRATTASTRFDDPIGLGHLSIEPDPELLDEARRLTGLDDEDEIVRQALAEFVERQRFLRWVALHEKSEADT